MTYIYEKLDVWQKAMQFAGKIMDTVPTSVNAHEYQKVMQNIGAKSTQIAGAIAAGKSYTSKHDFAKHLYRSRGALYETMTMLELLKQKQIIPEDKYIEFDASANQITAMLTNLVKSLYKPKSDNAKAEN
ncbi:MAG: four helix bundle protein [Deltaproteobacteria bacterium]|nr:four helix bundle protein [Deltaproteobacteria bacterium]